MDITVSFMFHLHREYAEVITVTAMREGSEDYSGCRICACMVSRCTREVKIIQATEFVLVYAFKYI